MIRLEHVSKTFAKGNVEAVHDVSLTVQDGEIYGIIGFSGAGKSTLVRCVNLLERPTGGRVWIDDTELTALSGKALCQARRSIGMIFQHFNLMPSRTVLENVVFPLWDSPLSKADRQAKARELLQIVGLTEKENAYPSQLSGGQKQRVAIARTLASDPKVLICDEATSALDPQTTHAILQLLKELNRRLGLTILIITHEMAVVKELCQRVAVMERGRVVEEADVFTLFSLPKQPVTRRFIDSTSNLSKIDQLLAEHSPVAQLQPGEELLRLRFMRKSACRALISQASRQLELDINIIFGDIEIIQDAPLGGLIVIVGGEAEKLAAFKAYLKDNDVSVEVISRD